MTWFAAGTVAGAVGAAWAYTQVRDARGRAVADQLADRVVGASRRVGGRVREAVSEGVQTMRETQAELDRDPRHPDRDSRRVGA
ncbi:MAG: hypothetical protein HYX32_12595 [Actinobacteria bacterium]|nr:hypothetical protein [Actinomycetota bacterium]